MYLEPGGFASCKFNPCADVSTGVGSHNIYIPYGACCRELTTGISCTISRINTQSSDKFMQCICLRFIETDTIQATYSKNSSLESWSSLPTMIFRSYNAKCIHFAVRSRYDHVSLFVSLLRTIRTDIWSARYRTLKFRSWGPRIIIHVQISGLNC